MKINFKQGKKCFIGFLVLIIVVGGGLYILRNTEIEIKFDENGSLVVPDKKWYEGYLSFSERVVDLQDRLLEMEKMDDFGGATPQETFDSFVEALKAGDIDLASKYFVFNKREQMFGELSVGKENGSIGAFLEYADKIDEGKEHIKGYYRFTVPEDGMAVMSFDLRFNENTKVWKIESL